MANIISNVFNYFVMFLFLCTSELVSLILTMFILYCFWFVFCLFCFAFTLSTNTAYDYDERIYGWSGLGTYGQSREALYA